MKLSVLMVVFNEEDVIRDALESITGWVEEIIIVDSHSSDRTVEICREYTDKIFIRDWPGFIEQKNFALRQCRGEWVLNLDADERVSARLRQSIQETLQNPQEFEGYYLNRRSNFLGAWIHHSGWYPDRVLRLFQRDRGRWSGYEPHAAVQLQGQAGQLEGDLEHYPYRNLRHHLEKLNRYSTERATALHAQGKKCRLSDLVLRPALSFFKKIILKQAFRDGSRGVFIALLTALSVYAKYAKLWELQQVQHQKQQKNGSS
jgi:glycosyltransferase involved in cell wall biosynthesis